MDTKGEPGSEGLTPRPDIDEFKDRVAAGEYDEIRNGAEVYESPNGMRFVINDQEGADLIVGQKDEPKPPVENPAGSRYVFAHDRDGITAANNHTQAEPEPQTPLESPAASKYVFAHDRDGITAANNHKTGEASPAEPVEPEKKITAEDPGVTRIEPVAEQETPPRVIKQNYWDNPEKIKANFSSFDEAMSDEDAKRYGAFQDGESPIFPPGPSITEDSDIFKKYQKSLAEKQDEPAIEPITEPEQITPEITPAEIEIQELREENQRLLAERNALIEERNQVRAEMENLRGEVLTLLQEVARLRAIVEAPVEAPAEAPVEAPAEAPVEAPIEAPAEAPIEAPGEAPAEAPVEAPVEAPAEAPGITRIEPPPQAAPQPIPQAAPQPIPQAAPQPIPQAAPQPIPQAAPQPIPQAAPQVAVNAEILKTPEQRLVEIDQRIAALEQIVLNGGSLNLAQGQEYAALNMARRQLSEGIASMEKESQARRDNREKWIKRAGFIAGVGVALATPAVGCAAIIAVTLGGNLIGKGLKILEGRTRAKSTAMKYESREGKSKDQVEAMDKKQKRSEWWANRLGEASALLIGGASGYGFGSIIQNVFGVGFGAGAPTPPTPEVPPTGEITPPTGEIVPPNTGGGELPPTGEIIPPVEGAGESVLVQDGRINLPGSAWDGNLASGPAQDTLLGGANNPSNFNGSLHEMAPFRLEEALVQNGITRAELTSQLDTAEIHQLLNRALEATRSGNPIDLAQMLDSVKPGVSDILLGGN